MPKQGYRPKTGTVDGIINEKIKVLRDFYVVDSMNEESIRNTLFIAVRDNPNRDPNVIVDRVAKSLIAAKL